MKKILYISIIALLAVAGIVASMKFAKRNAPVTAMEPVELSNENIADALDDIVPGIISKIDIETSAFEHTQYGFTLNYPSSMKVTNFREGAGEMVLFQDDVKKMWFQMYITPWDEAGDLSVARIRKDMPSLVIINPQSVILGPKQKEGVGPHAVIFFSKDSGLGETFEVWFAFEGNLYQITTYRTLDSTLGKILSTLVFAQ